MQWRTLSAGLIAAVLTFDVATAELVLEKVVLISRHGVRSPTETHPPLAEIASRAWPTWPVPPGHLTPRGEQLASRMGEYYRAHYAARGLIPAQGCPAPNQIYLWADVDQRTRQTGEGLLNGFAPGCNISAQHAATDKADPVFHPVRAGVCTVDKERGRAAVLARVGGDLDSVVKAHRGALRRLQSVTGCCAPKLCQANNTGRCTLLNMPSGIAVRDKDNGVQLAGPIPIGSTASEVFLLEYADGLPLRQVAWGRVSSPAALNPLLRLHRVQFDLIERTPYLAARQSSALLHQIVEALRPVAERAAGASPAVPAESKLVVFVGHDTNLANIGGMLGLHWNLKTYVPDETPPAGALAFELLRDTDSGRYFVRTTYFSQTLDQMRRLTRLSLRNPPEQARVALPGCSAAGHGDACPWPDFDARVKKALDPECVAAARR